MPPNLPKVPPTFATERTLLLAGQQQLAGFNEVGVGAIAGPVIAAAVVLPLPVPGVNFDQELMLLANRLGEVQDSKYLYRDHKERLYPLICEVALAVGVGIVDVPELSALRNQTRAASIAMTRALETLSVSPDVVLLDGLIRLETSAIPSVTITKLRGATTSISIAAASIVASVTFTRIMVDYGAFYPVYRFHEHRGYPSPAHVAALTRYGPSPIHHPHNKLVQNVAGSRRGPCIVCSWSTRDMPRAGGGP